MFTNRKRKISFKKNAERAILSDVLPYEAPVTFSNRSFYNFLLKNKIQVININDKYEFSWSSTDSTDLIMNIINPTNSYMASNFENIKNAYTNISNLKNELVVLILHYKNENDKLFPQDEATKLVQDIDSLKNNETIDIQNIDDIINNLEDIQNKYKLNNVDTILKSIKAVKTGLDKFKKNEENKKKRLYIINADRYTIPFKFLISHQENNFRELSLIHPINQLFVSNFYDNNWGAILHFCNVSPYSIRRPTKIGNSVFAARKKGKEITEDINNIEILNQKTFFSNKDFSNIFKFYDSEKYHSNEKRFDKLFKFDISKCFNSIYTHSIAWAVYNKEIVKDKLGEHKESFSDSFDKLMQKMNYNETNGIVVGPEVSRIFAEIILQRIDVNVFKKLKEIEIIQDRDYAIFRFVDDYFLYYNDELIKEKALDFFKIELKEYKLYLNDSKNVDFSKPFMTEISVAKKRITELVDETFAIKVEENDKEEKIYKFNFIAEENINRFKIIIKESNAKYIDIMNYTLAIINYKMENIVNQYEKKENIAEKDEKYFKKNFMNSILYIIEFVFFLYTVSPRVNMTIKLVDICNKIIKLFRNPNLIPKKRNFSNDEKAITYGKLYHEIMIVLKKIKNTEFIQVETLYLLIILSELGRDYRVDEEILMNFFKVNKKNNEFEYELNYWAITVLLYYIKDIKKYDKIKYILKEEIKKKYQNVKSEIRHYSELTILTLDLLLCPFLNDDNYAFKIYILNNFYGFSEKDKKKNIEILKSLEGLNLFTSWYGLDLEKELTLKRGMEVY